MKWLLLCLLFFSCAHQNNRKESIELDVLAKTIEHGGERDAISGYGSISINSNKKNLILHGVMQVKGDSIARLSVENPVGGQEFLWLKNGSDVLVQNKNESPKLYDLTSSGDRKQLSDFFKVVGLDLLLIDFWPSLFLAKVQKGNWRSNGNSFERLAHDYSEQIIIDRNLFEVRERKIFLANSEIHISYEDFDVRGGARVARFIEARVFHRGVLTCRVNWKWTDWQPNAGRESLLIIKK